LRIGVFDSGIGGLTVLRALHRRWPGHSTIYLGDTARVPYGTKSPETVARYAMQAARLLMGEGVDLLVVACNTASATALDALAALPLPIIGVIEPGARAAAAAAPSPDAHIAVIGTHATVQSGAYQRALARLLPAARVTALACPLFVALADEGWESTPVAREVARTYFAPWIEGSASARPEVMVLGCTHYPVLKGAIAAALGPDVRLIDSAETTAEALAPHLDGLPAETFPTHRLVVTDGAAGFLATAERILGRAGLSFDVVDLPTGQ
jgi:glutamate racemase